MKQTYESESIPEPFAHLTIPDFQEFIQKPKDPTCPIIESTRIMVEVLGWNQNAESEFALSSFSEKLLLGGEFALVIRYRRKKDGVSRPTCTLSFRVESDWLHISQFQGSNDKRVAFRFHSSFNSLAFFLRVMELSYIRRGIPVTVDPFPAWLENAAYGSRASEKYAILRSALEWLNHKYNALHHDPQWNKNVKRE